jgi:hypothetical protein
MYFIYSTPNETERHAGKCQLGQWLMKGSVRTFVEELGLGTAQPEPARPREPREVLAGRPANHQVELGGLRKARDIVVVKASDVTELDVWRRPRGRERLLYHGDRVGVDLRRAVETQRDLYARSYSAVQPPYAMIETLRPRPTSREQHSPIGYGWEQQNTIDRKNC